MYKLFHYFSLLSGVTSVCCVSVAVVRAGLSSLIIVVKVIIIHVMSGAGLLTTLNL